jgi:hypothetical protein
MRNEWHHNRLPRDCFRLLPELYSRKQHLCYKQQFPQQDFYQCYFTGGLLLKSHTKWRWSFWVESGCRKLHALWKHQWHQKQLLRLFCRLHRATSRSLRVSKLHSKKQHLSRWPQQLLPVVLGSEYWRAVLPASWRVWCCRIRVELCVGILFALCQQQWHCLLCCNWIWVHWVAPDTWLLPKLHCRKQHVRLKQ